MTSSLVDVVDVLFVMFDHRTIVTITSALSSVHPTLFFLSFPFFVRTKILMNLDLLLLPFLGASLLLTNIFFFFIFCTIPFIEFQLPHRKVYLRHTSLLCLSQMINASVFIGDKISSHYPHNNYIHYFESQISLKDYWI